MGLDKLPTWAGRTTGDAAASEPRAARALDPETGEPVPRLNLWQRVTMRLLSKGGDLLVKRWAPRQLLKLLTVAATYIGASESDTAGTVAFLVAGLSALLELLGSALSRRFLKLQS